MKISIVLSSTALAVALLGSTPLGHAALGGSDRAVLQAKPPATSKPNVTYVTDTFTVSQEAGGLGAVAEGRAICPAGTRVFSGGYAAAGLHTKFNVAAPEPKKINAFVVDAFEPPINIAAGIGRETAKITVVGLCAPIGKPIVLR
jgi:hypothetical protein